MQVYLSRSGVIGPKPGLIEPAMLWAMPYFLEYVTSVGAGRFTLEGVDDINALVKAKEALQGLGCTRAALLYAPAPISVFGAGRILAAYTRADGWTARSSPFSLNSSQEV